MQRNDGWKTLQEDNKFFEHKLLAEVSAAAMITLTYHNGTFKQVDNFGNYEEHREKMDLVDIRDMSGLGKKYNRSCVIDLMKDAKTDIIRTTTLSYEGELSFEFAVVAKRDHSKHPCPHIDKICLSPHE